MSTQQITQALCDTLLWSLALGVLMAAIAGLLVLSTRHASARLRYQLLISLMGVFAISTIAIFCYPLLHTNATLTSVGQTFTGVPLQTSIVYVPAAGGLVSLLRGYSGIIVSIWSLIVLAKTIQLLTGLQRLYFLRCRQITPVNPEWENRLGEISTHLGITRVVQMAESGLAKMPMVIGHLKPIILIPAGMLTALPPAALEAILVHELAHILRRDYLVNLLISSLEIVFFFNPAVLWVGTLIRSERENCCDDIAVTYTNNKAGYIQALVACHEYQPANLAYAMAFGKKDQFLNRAKRVLYSRNSSLNLVERTVLGLTLLTTVVITAAFSHTEKIKALTVRVKHAVSKNTTTAKVIIPHFAAVQPQTAFLSVSDTIKAKKTVYPDTLAKSNGIQSSLAPVNTTLSPLATPLKLGKTSVTVSQVINTNISVDIKDSNPKPPVAQVAPVARPAEPAKSVQEYEKARQAYAANSYHDDTNRSKLTAGLIADGIITNAKQLTSFKLSDREFIVNGQKMTEEVYQKFKEMYVPETGKKGTWSWLYNYEEN